MSGLYHGAKDGIWSLDPFNLPSIALGDALDAYGHGWNKRDRELWDEKQKKLNR